MWLEARGGEEEESEEPGAWQEDTGDRDRVWPSVRGQGSVGRGKGMTLAESCQNTAGAPIPLP